MLNPVLYAVLVLIGAVLLGAAASWVSHTRQLRRRLDAAPRVAAATTELHRATAEWETGTARAHAVLTAQTAAPTGGFGDAHVTTARLRAALARIEQEQP